jgi:hypothetical protein
MKDGFLSAIYNWFASNKRKILNFAIIVVFVCPILIWLIYFIGKAFWGIPTDISADGFLGYIAAIISSVATVFLGFITLGLSNRANKTNDDLLLLQREQFLLETRPFIMPTDWKIKPQKLKSIIYSPDRIYICIDNLKDNIVNVAALSLHLTNTTKSFELVEYSGGHIINRGKRTNFRKSADNQFNTKIMLLPGATKELVLYGSETFFNRLKGKKFVLSFILENRLGKRFKEEFEVEIVYYSPYFLRGLGFSDVSLSIGNYEVTEIL